MRHILTAVLAVLAVLEAEACIPEVVEVQVHKVILVMVQDMEMLVEQDQRQQKEAEVAAVQAVLELMVKQEEVMVVQAEPIAYQVLL